MRIRMKRRQNLESELQEEMREQEDEFEEEFPDPIEIPDVFPEDLSEDMETDVPDDPEPELQKKGIFQNIINFFKGDSFEESEEEEDDDDDDDEFTEDDLESEPSKKGLFKKIIGFFKRNEEDDDDENDEDDEDDEEFTEDDTSEEFTENSLENDILEDLPEIIPEDELLETPLENNSLEIMQQTIFPELDENELEIAPDTELPDLEYMDDIADLPNPMELDEPDQEESEHNEELADAPEIMPDDLQENFNITDNMILMPEENTISDKSHETHESHKKPAPESEIIVEKPKSHVLGKLIAAAFVIIFVAVIVICFRNGVFDEKEIYYMPDLVGLDYYNLNLENDLNLDIQVDGSALSGYDENMIYEQDIPAGEVIELGQTVHVNISSGFAMEIIPDVRNYQSAYAKKMLEQAGFKTEIQYEMSLGGTKMGNVIRTEPEIGEEIVIGTVVTMFVSQGSDNTSAPVPNVVGMSLEKAITLCEESGLTVDAVAVPSMEAENTVISQNLEANTQVNFGTVIILNYSNAEAPAGTVNYQLELPAYANGRFTIDFIDPNGTVLASDTLVAGFSAGSAIPVESYGKQQIRVILNNDATAQQAEIGVYDFDFTTGIYTIITEDVKKAFEAVNGIG
ncbi:MAG: PASTA domain-containing protein [Ruminococcus sp.]|nr:PASTA domain-containing protein [Ruminococcus sp.]